MLPASIVLLDALPLTNNGKLDCRALESLPSNPGATEDMYVAPRTAEEEKLANIWKDLLQVERVGVHDDFTELGGNSLMAVQAISRIQASFGVRLSVRRFLEAPTVAALAKRIEATARHADPSYPMPLRRGSSASRAKLSHGQEQLWHFIERYPEIQLGTTNKVGIFSKISKMDAVLREGDRVEIYRPLIADPKEVRRQRAEEGKVTKKGAAEKNA